MTMRKLGHIPILRLTPSYDQKETAGQDQPAQTRRNSRSLTKFLIVCRNHFRNVDQVVLRVGSGNETVRIVDDRAVTLDREP